MTSRRGSDGHHLSRHYGVIHCSTTALWFENTEESHASGLMMLFTGQHRRPSVYHHCSSDNTQQNYNHPPPARFNTVQLLN